MDDMATPHLYRKDAHLRVTIIYTPFFVAPFEVLGATPTLQIEGTVLP